MMKATTGAKYTFEVWDREGIENFMEGSGCAMIVLTNPGLPRQEFNFKGKSMLLYLDFHDAQISFESREIHNINMQQCDSLIHFVEMAVEKGITRFAFHCEYAQGRSPGVGAAVSYMLGESNSFFFKEFPNLNQGTFHRIMARVKKKGWGAYAKVESRELAKV